MAFSDGPTQFSIPIQALRAKTREQISTRLNPTKVIPTDEGLPRDWRGLAHLAGLNGNDIPLIASKSDPTGQVLNMWGTSSLGQLIDILRQLDRYDVIDDTSALFDQDAEKYRETQEKSIISTPTINLAVDKQILTVDDVSRLEQGFAPQYYDAFLLFADEDIDFASQIVEKMETKYNLKLCLRDRDLVGGLAFEHEAIMRLISERCNRLIVIVSPSFLKSEANKFFVTFAQALGIDQRQRKVVPCLYQRCVLPPELSYYFLLDFTRSGTLWDFWAKMRDSLQTPAQRSNALSIKEFEEKETPKELHKIDYSNPHNSFDISSSFKSLDKVGNSGNLTYDTQSNLSTEKPLSPENIKQKLGKRLRSLLTKSKSKKKLSEAMS